MEGYFPYLNTEYARQKMIEGYDREAAERERKLVEELALQTITEINERYIKINGLEEA